MSVMSDKEEESQPDDNVEAKSKVALSTLISPSTSASASTSPSASVLTRLATVGVASRDDVDVNSTATEPRSPPAGKILTCQKKTLRQFTGAANHVGSTESNPHELLMNGECSNCRQNDSDDVQVTVTTLESTHTQRTTRPKAKGKRVTLNVNANVIRFKREHSSNSMSEVVTDFMDMDLDSKASADSDSTVDDMTMLEVADGQPRYR